VAELLERKIGILAQLVDLSVVARAIALSSSGTGVALIRLFAGNGMVAEIQMAPLD
jgi:hypothetical protein